MEQFSRAESSIARARLDCWKYGLPDDVEALKALVIDLHARAQEQERCIERQRDGLRRIAHNVEALRKVACTNHADDRRADEQDEARLIPHGNNGRNGSG
jgi:hypothetical protein